MTGVLCITALSHLPSLKNHLVADSWVFVYPYSFIETLGFFSKSIIPPEWKSFWFRPVPMLFFWVDNLVWPGTEWGPHLTNIIFHLCNVYLIWKLIQFTLNTVTSSKSDTYFEFPAFTACLVYGIHPLTVGSVDWVAARFDVMSVTFGLAGLLVWFQWERGIGSIKYAVGSAILFIIAILSKEQGIVFLLVSYLISTAKAYVSKNDRKKYLNYIILITLMVVFYLIYRFIIFNGIGGYIQSERGLSFIPPFAFLTVILFPYLNIYSAWTVTISFLIASFLLAASILLLWSVPFKHTVQIKKTYSISAGLLFIFGLITTAPHVIMTFTSIVNFSESRFALIPITGLSLLAGYGISFFIRTVNTYRIILVVILVWGILSAWRTSVQIQAWKLSGLISHHIITSTLSMAPEPPQNSVMLFFDIPRSNQYYAYIFGIGLKEAILRHYPGRNDITIIPNASGKDLKWIKSERDYVFGFNKSKDKLERLFPQKKLSPR